MTKLYESKFISIMATEYRKRLLEALSEVDVIDKAGNVIISKDLKVRHKDSGFEYTVDRVEGTGDNLQIYLRDPEGPRVPDPGEESLLSANSNLNNTLTEQDPVEITPPEYDPELEFEDISDVDIFVVDKTEFEKEYEVK